MLQFRKLFGLIAKKWLELKLDNGLHVIEEITAKGSKFGHLYRGKC